MKIVILGGTFDPIHLGHVALAQRAKEQFHLNKIFFIPAGIPPHKQAHENVTPAPHRFRMVELAIEGISDFKVLPIETKRAGISYTVDTLDAFKKIYPDDELYLILGADSLAEIPTWREPERIQQLAKMIVVPRRASKTAAYPENVLKIDMPICDLSSSEIREKIRQGKSVHGMLTPRVEEY